MITIITNAPVEFHSRTGAAKGNRPELRQKLILNEIVNYFPKCKVIYDKGTLTSQYLSKVHDLDYLDFLQKAFVSLNESEDNDWSDKTGALIPNHMSKRKPLSQVPMYKFSGYYGSDFMTPIYKDSWDNANLSAYLSYMASQTLCQADDPCNVVYSLVCSPGHHAKTNQYGGYCFLNNACIAALRINELTEKKVAILDLDIHAGQGTAQIVNDNPLFKDRIFACSIHTDPTFEYPSFEGFEHDYNNESIINIPLKGNPNWNKYKTALLTAGERIKEWEVEVLVIAFGADTYMEDPDVSEKGRFRLELEDYDQMGKTIRELFPIIPILVTQEGGYCLDKVPEIVCRFLRNIISI